MPTKVRVIVVSGKKTLMDKLKVNMQEFKLGNIATRQTIMALLNTALDEKYITKAKHRQMMASIGL